MFDNTDFSIIVNPDILDETYVLPRIPGRDNQIREIASYLAPATKNMKPTNLWVHGAPGTGKTSTAKYMLKELERVNVNGFYINCWSANTLYSILDEIAREMRLFRADTQSTRVKLRRIEESLKNKSVIFVLDEIGKPQPKDRNRIIYHLCNIKNSGVVCICNSGQAGQAYNDLNGIVRSRLKPKFIEFKPYSVNDLVEILKERAVLALAPETWDESIPERIAELSKGDSRSAIQTLRDAAYHADTGNNRIITEEDVMQGYDEAKNLKKTYRLDRLTRHHRLLFNLIKESPDILSGDLWNEYIEKCSEKVKPIARRTYTNYITGLMETGLVKAEKATVKGKTRSFKVI